MITRKKAVIVVAFLTLILAVASPGIAQPLTGAFASLQHRYSTPMPPGIAAPDTMETRFGTLNFFDGFPCP